MKKQLSLCALLAIELLGLCPISIAGTIWDGGDSSLIWSRPNNWNDNIPPDFNSAVTLEFATLETSASIDADYTVGSLLFNRDAAFAINQNGTDPLILTLHNGIVVADTQTAERVYTLSVKTALGNNNTWTVNNPTAGGTNSLTLSSSSRIDLASYQLLINGAGNTNLDGTIIGAGSIYKSGAGILSIGNLNSTFGGGLTVAEGTVGFNDISGNGASAGSGPLVLMGGKVCTDTNGGGVTLKTSSVSIINTVEFGTGLSGNRQLNFTGPVYISDNAVLNFSNIVGNKFDGLTTLQGNFTATGTGAGAAQFMGGLSLGDMSRTMTLNRSDGSVEFSGPLGADAPGLDLTLAGSAPGAKVGIYNYPLTDAVGKSPVRIVVDATGSVTFLGGNTGNTYSGGTLIKAGTVKMTGGNLSTVITGPFGTGPLTIQGGTLANFYNGGGTVLYNTVNVTGSFEYATLDFNRMIWFSGPVTFSNNPTVTHNGNMGTSSDLSFLGAVNLQSNVAFAGSHTGELDVKSTALNLGGVDRTITFNDAGTGATSIKSVLSGAPAKLTINGSRDLEAYFTGATAHSVEFAGSAVYTLHGDTSDYTGGTYISNGATVKLYPYGYGSDSARALPNDSTLTIKGAGSTFDIADWIQDLGSITMTGGNVIDSVGTHSRILGLGGNLATFASADTATISCPLSLNGATRTFSVADGSAKADLQVSGIISKGSLVSNHAGIIKQGNGRLILSGANTFDLGVVIEDGVLAAGNNTALGLGATSIKSGGKLEIMAGISISNAVTIESGGAIGGSGTYVGNLSMPAGSVLDPGSSAGTFTINGNLTPAAGTHLRWELGETLSQYDVVNILGNLILPGHGATDEMILHLSNPSGLNPTGQEFTFITWTGADPLVHTPWTIDYGATGWYGGVITSNHSDADGLPGGYYMITGMTVPEPGSLGLFSIATLALLTRKRR